MGPNDLRRLSDDGLAAHDVAQVTVIRLRAQLASVTRERDAAHVALAQTREGRLAEQTDYQQMIKRLQQEVSEGEKLAATVRKAMLDLVEVVRRVAQGAGLSSALDTHAASAACLQAISTTLHAMCDDAESRVQ